MKTIFIIGAGYVAGEAASLLLDQGMEVSLGKRQPTRGVPTELLGKATIHAMDVQDPESYPSALLDAEVIIYCVASDGFSPEQYRRAYSEGLGKVLLAIQAHRERLGIDQTRQRLVFVSSTGVYSQEDGSLVDEHAAAQPTAFSGQIMREAELALEAFSARTPGFEGSAVRFSGIYGPGRTRMIQEISASKPVSAKRWNQYTNRIHRDDCARALVHLVVRDQVQPYYVASDQYPATFGEIATWLAARLGVHTPPVVEELALASPNAEPNAEPNAGPKTGPKTGGGLERGGHKRCWSTGLLAEGFQFRFPSFKDGYDSLIISEGL